MVFCLFQVTKATEIVIVYLFCEGMLIVSDANLFNDVCNFSILQNYLIFTQPPIQWAMGLFGGVKGLGRGLDHAPHLAPRLKKV